MNKRLQAAIARLNDPEIIRLAVAVRDELEEEADAAPLAKLDPGAATVLAERLAEIESRRERLRAVAEPTDSGEWAELSRSFLDALIEAEVFDEIIAENLMNVGVRGATTRVVEGFGKRFDMPGLAAAAHQAAASGEPPAAATADDWGLPREHRVWFGTNRAPVDRGDPARGFSNERDPAGAVRYGTCAVYIPRTHKFGSTGTSFWQRWRRLEFTDDALELRQIDAFDSADAFLAALRQEMSGREEDEKTVLVYLHGYNTSFEDAALRAAQIGFDLRVETTAFYSWPSKEEVKGYPADVARVEASERQIAGFLSAVATGAGAARVHVMAHSMGNRGFARAVARITSHATRTSNVRFGQIILAAPDLDVDLFKELAVAYPKISDRTTMYVSAKDKALAMSGFLQDSDRAGFTPPVTVLEGIDTVEVTEIDVDRLGHGYFAEAEAVLYDMKQLLVASTPPDKRIRTEAVMQTGGRYWTLRA